MDGFSKTQYNSLNEIDDDNVVGVEPIMENFNILDSSMGKIEQINIEGYSGSKTVKDVINFLGKKIKELNTELSGAVSVINEINNGL